MLFGPSHDHRASTSCCNGRVYNRDQIRRQTFPPIEIFRLGRPIDHDGGSGPIDQPLVGHKQDSALRVVSLNGVCFGRAARESLMRCLSRVVEADDTTRTKKQRRYRAVAHRSHLSYLEVFRSTCDSSHSPYHFHPFLIWAHSESREKPASHSNKAFARIGAPPLAWGEFGSAGGLPRHHDHSCDMATDFSLSFKVVLRWWQYEFHPSPAVLGMRQSIRAKCHFLSLA